MSRNPKRLAKKRKQHKDFAKRNRMAKQQLREIKNGTRKKFSIDFPDSKKWTKPKSER